MQRGGARAKQGEKRTPDGFRLCFAPVSEAERCQWQMQRGGARAKQGEKRTAGGFRLCFAPVRVVGSSPTWGAKKVIRSDDFFSILHGEYKSVF